MIMTAHTSRQRGFTLLEMVIVLGIMSSLLAAFFSFYQPMLTAQSNAATKQKMERVMNALSSYALRVNHLPCPAWPQETTSTLIGKTDYNAGHCTAPVARGIVPYVDLGLSEDDVKDGFGHFMTYLVPTAVTTPTTDATDLGSVFCSPTLVTDSNLIQVRRPAGVVESRMVVALISYGAGGVGAYNMEQSLASASNRRCAIGSESCSNYGQLDTKLGTNERENVVDRMGNNIYIDPYSTQVGTSHFDDTVGYTTGVSLIGRFGLTGCLPP